MGEFPFAPSSDVDGQQVEKGLPPLIAVMLSPGNTAHSLCVFVFLQARYLGTNTHR